MTTNLGRVLYGLTRESLMRAVVCSRNENRRASRVPQMTCSLRQMTEAGNYAAGRSSFTSRRYSAL